MAEPQKMVPESSRMPTVEERRAAVELAKRIRKVTYPDKARTKIRTDVPPGRIRMGEAMKQYQQIVMNQPVTAQPFTHIKRAHTIHTPITCGIMCDISGSMSSAQLPLGVARWVLADAIHQVNGSVAAVLFGNYGHAIQAPHERVRKIEVYDAGGGHENFVEGFSLIDGALDLIDGHGARLLVIITDGHFVLQEAVEYAEVVMDMCKRAGVAVIWVTVREYFARPDAYGHGQIVEIHTRNPLEMARVLGDAVIDEFRKAAPQHMLLSA